MKRQLFYALFVIIIIVSLIALFAAKFFTIGYDRDASYPGLYKASENK